MAIDRAGKPCRSLCGQSEGDVRREMSSGALVESAYARQFRYSALMFLKSGDARQRQVDALLALQKVHQQYNPFITIHR